MSSGATIATTVLRAVLAEAAASPDHEICGLLIGTPGAVIAHLPARNVAADPPSAFEIDPAALIAAHRAERAGGPAIVGCYHSHPSGSPDPSPRDAAAAEPNGWLWLIVAGGKARLWRASVAGERHGRFDRVPLACADAPASPENGVCR